MLEILGDQRIPYEGDMKRIRAEGDFLLGASSTGDECPHCGDIVNKSVRTRLVQSNAAVDDGRIPARAGADGSFERSITSRKAKKPSL